MFFAFYWEAVLDRLKRFPLMGFDPEKLEECVSLKVSYTFSFLFNSRIKITCILLIWIVTF